MTTMSWLPPAAASPRIRAFGDELFHALSDRRPIAPLIARDPTLTIDDAYEISLHFLRHRLQSGEQIIGKKIGITSKAVQDMLGVRQPDFGFLTDAMQRADGEAIDIVASRLLQPRAEAEIAFILGKPLIGPNIDEAAVLAATASIAPCFEIVDSRVENWNISIVDTVADNASCGVFVLGEARADPRMHDLPALKVKVWKNGAPLSEGVGAAALGSPLTSVAWAANTLGGYGAPLLAGDIILSGSLVPLEPVVAGDSFEMDLIGIGRVSTRFR